MLALLAIVCIGGAIVLGGYVALHLYADQHNGLELTCDEQQDVPPGAADNAGMAVQADIGLIPLGVWCTYPAADGGHIIVAPPWRLSGVAAASVGLLALGVFAGVLRSRLRESALTSRD